MIPPAYAMHKLTSCSLLPPLHPQISKFSSIGLKLTDLAVSNH
jgi:hypothetical protein